MRYPLDEEIDIVQGFGENGYDYAQWGLVGHHGCDCRALVPKPVYAPEHGYILKSANGLTDDRSGRYVAGETIIIQGDSFEHWLLHLSKRLAYPGEEVQEGELIGYTGATGEVTGPHLHWGVRPHSPDMTNGYRGYINPMIALSSKRGDEMIDTDNKARDLFVAILHEVPENISDDAIQSVKGQPYAEVVRALVNYDKWRSQNDKLVAYDQIQTASTTDQSDAEKFRKIKELLK